MFQAFGRFLRQAFCQYRLRFIRNIYGDEIYEYGHDRPLWGCQKCGKVKSLPDLHL